MAVISPADCSPAGNGFVRALPASGTSAMVRVAAKAVKRCFTMFPHNSNWQDYNRISQKKARFKENQGSGAGVYIYNDGKC